MRKFPSAFALANRPRRVRTAYRPNPAPSIYGSRATGFRRGRTTGGTTATGRGRRMRARTGASRTTSMDGISQVSGKANAATSRMTIVGTEIENETNVAISVATRGTETENGTNVAIIATA